MIHPDSNVIVVDHPFVTDSLAHLRNKETDIRRFRFHSDQICRLLFAEAIRGLSFKRVKIETPMIATTVEKLADEVMVVPILRAGLAMMTGAMAQLPKSKIGFVGLERNEKTAKAREYYWKLPAVSKQTVVMITDPMLATGGSILHVLRRMKGTEAKEVRVVCVVAAPEGIAYIRREFPVVKIYAAAVDEKLNRVKYIVPGLGDYGDRYFGTGE